MVQVPALTESTVYWPAAEPGTTVATPGWSAVADKAEFVDEVAVKLALCATPLNEIEGTLSVTTDAGTGAPVGEVVGRVVGVIPGAGTVCTGALPPPPQATGPRTRHAASNVRMGIRRRRQRRESFIIESLGAQNQKGQYGHELGSANHRGC